MRAAASGAGACARVGIRVGDCLPRSSRAETAELFAAANTCPPSLSPSLPLSPSCARGSILTRHFHRDANRSISQVPPGSSGAGLSGRGASSAQPPFEEAEPGAVQTEAELATMDKKQRWARAGHAKRSETDAFPSRAAVACRYPTFVLQMVPKRKLTRWISGRRILVGSKRILQRTMHVNPADGSSRATFGSSRAYMPR
jgi:hypothetical protein